MDTYFHSEEDFRGFVSKLGGLLPAIMSKVDEISNAGGSNVETDDEE